MIECTGLLMACCNGNEVAEGIRRDLKDFDRSTGLSSNNGGSISSLHGTANNPSLCLKKARDYLSQEMALLPELGCYMLLGSLPISQICLCSSMVPQVDTTDCHY